MSESILMALVQLFAIVAAAGKKQLTGNARDILVSYFQRHLNRIEQEEYLKLFDELLFFHQPMDDEVADPAVTVQNIKQICGKVNKELKQRDKVIVFIKFVEFLEEGYTEELKGEELPGEVPFIFFETISSAFNFEEAESHDILNFVTDKNSGRRERLLVISAVPEEPDLKWIKRDLLDGQVRLLHLDSVKTFIGLYSGNDTIFLNGHNILPRRSFYFDNGDILKGQKLLPVYYSDVSRQFLGSKEMTNIEFTAKDIEYHFKNSKNGIQPFSFTAESGELIGIMGGSGVGKSTLLNLLNGNIPPENGQITINGYDLHSDIKVLKGSIGFVPQDDLLIEELTVYQNLHFNARLCFDSLSPEKLHDLVTRMLEGIDLLEHSKLKVGDPLNKTISGGQRKRLNIALELIRQPAILLADEPTSGLSSMDSDMVMTLLKEQTLKGRLVFVNIHQPSSDIFKLFDKLLIMDKGGYPVYYGNPIEALSYFKKISNYVNPDESECLSCGYVNPEQILDILEAKLVNESGKETPRRKISPVEWYSHFQKKIQQNLKINDAKGMVPCCFLNLPDKLKQFTIFSHRNFLSKISNRQYMIITLVEAPLLAALLAFLTRYSQGKDYIFGQNPNLVAFLFMSVVVSLFLGMMVSAEEIIRDRRILKREAFLHLSRFSYLNSKILFLFLLSGIQSLLYVVTGNLILGINGMLFSYWFILFSTSCVANMIGLNISAGMNSVVSIYITIPFLIVPQLLLSGTVVAFDNLNPSISSKQNVPLIGDVMPSRWAFEALAVDQFKNNDYEKIFYPYEQEVSRYKYITAHQIPYLQSMVSEISRDIALGKNKDLTIKHLNLLGHEFSGLNKGITKTFQSSSMDTCIVLLDSLSRYYSSLLMNATSKRDNLYESLSLKYGGNGIVSLRQENYNENLADLVLNNTSVNKVIEADGKLIRKKDPVFAVPEARNGRAQLYAPVKIIGNLAIDTFWFNTGILWIMTILLYVALLTDVLRKASVYLKKMKFREEKGAR